MINFADGFFSKYFLILSNFRADWVKKKKCCCRHIIILHNKKYIYKIENKTRIHYSHIPLYFQINRKIEKFWTLGNQNLHRDGVMLGFRNFKQNQKLMKCPLLFILNSRIDAFKQQLWNKRNQERCFPYFEPQIFIIYSRFYRLLQKRIYGLESKMVFLFVYEYEKKSKCSQVLVEIKILTKIKWYKNAYKQIFFTIKNNKPVIIIMQSSTIQNC